MFVKVCGITTAAQLEWAIDLGYSAAGVVMHPESVRYSYGRAAELTRHGRGRISTVAVGLTFEEVADVYNEFDFIQIYEHRDLDRVICAGDSKILARGSRLFMYDASRGSGQSAALPQWLHGVRTKLIISGGLSPRNIGSVIREFHPFGVDVSSGVESAPGVKDYELMKQFISEVTNEVR